MQKIIQHKVKKNNTKLVNLLPLNIQRDEKFTVPDVEHSLNNVFKLLERLINLTHFYKEIHNSFFFFFKRGHFKQNNNFFNNFLTNVDSYETLRKKKVLFCLTPLEPKCELTPKVLAQMIQTSLKMLCWCRGELYSHF